MNNLDICNAGLDLIKEYEGFRSNVYQDQKGIWTIGWGTTYLSDGSKVTSHTPSVSEEEATELLHYGCRIAVKSINDHVSVALNQNQFDALVCFVYNIGIGGFQSSTLLRLLNDGDYDSVSSQLMRWNKADGVEARGLTRRRKAEAELFNS